MNYEDLFYRNFSIFTKEEQEKIRCGRVLIVGCGGIGGTVAVILARSGLEHFTLVEFDQYDRSNMNRQIGCFAETIGRNKAEVIRELILKINPQADVQVYPKMLTHAEIAPLMTDVDIVFPAADDLAFSVFMFRDARHLGKPALYIQPSGTWANVSIIPTSGPTLEDLQGLPNLNTYEELKKALEIRRYKLGTYFYLPLACWRVDYYRGFLEKGWRPTQICPIVWMSSSIGALEVLKWLSGKWLAVAAPRYWYITADKIRVNRMNRPSWQTLLGWQRRVLWWIFQTWFGPALEWMQGVWWELYNQWLTAKQDRKSLHFSPAGESLPRADYWELFQRNYGIFEDAEQEKIRKTKVLIIGCSGSGEAISIILARCGVENFVLVDEGIYQPSDMNRQPCCFSDTIGCKKVEATAKAIQGINPQAKVEVVSSLPLPLAIDDLVHQADIIIPASDDFSYSTLLFRSARRLGKPAILCLPAGAMGWVSVFTPEGKTLEDVLGAPPLDYEDLRAVVQSPEYRCAQYNFVTHGDWRVDWFRGYFKEGLPLALICSVEWMAASLAALEFLKVASGKWKPVVAPQCWYIKKTRIHRKRFSRFLSWHRKLGWRIFSSRRGKDLHRPIFWIWRIFFAFLRNREKDQSTDLRSKG